MKLITDDKALELSKMLLKNDKSIRDEMLEKINSTTTEIQTQMSEVNDKFEDINKKIENATSEISLKDIEKIFNKGGIK